MEEVLEKAKQALTAGRHQEALEHYIKAAVRWPECKQSIRVLLMDSLSAVLDEMVRVQGSSSPLFRRLVHSVHVLYSEDPVVAAVLGTKCLNEGAHKEAAVYLQSALSYDPYCLLARENMAVLNEQLVHRWHFKMLNDLTRNSAYFRAITSAVRSIPDCKVLDIGSGTGLLSMMAVRAGAKCVYACELNETFATMSCDILTTNLIKEHVLVINCPSTSMSVPAAIPARASLVVTETVDAGLLGEWIIPSLRHAWAELLLPRQPNGLTNQATAGGHVIPCGATVYVTLIECPEVRKQSSLMCSSVCGLDLQGVRLEGSCCAPSLGDRGYVKGHRPSGSTPLTLTREPYTCERLSSIRGSYRQLSKTVEALEFDFSNPQIPLPPSRLVSLSLTVGGTVDAIAVWFKLHLDHTHYILTVPSEETSWDQAVFPLATPLDIKEGGLVTVRASCSDTSLQMTIDSVEAVRSDGVEGVKMCLASSDATHLVERSDLLRLNDIDYTTAYQQAIMDVVGKLLKETVNGTEADSCATDKGARCVVLDLTQGLSVFGLIAAQQGADFVSISQVPSMYCTLMEELVQRNGLLDQVSVWFRNVSELVRTGVQWDLIICDVVSPQGTLHSGVLEETKALYSCSPSAVFIPSRVSVYLSLISSPCLRAWSSVLGTVPTLGFDVASHMNKYQITHYTDVDLTSVPHQPLSDHTHICTLTLGIDTTVDKIVNVEVTAQGTVTAIVYWFRVHLHGDKIIDTGPLCATDHWHQSVFMLPEDLTVSKGAAVTVHAVVRDSCLLLEVTEH